MRDMTVVSKYEIHPRFYAIYKTTFFKFFIYVGTFCEKVNLMTFDFLKISKIIKPFNKPELI